jgi:uncharacterized membrane protein YgcG
MEHANTTEGKMSHLKRCALAVVALAVALGTAACTDDAAITDPAMFARPAPEGAGNRLSFPVIWAEGVTKVLPGTPGMIPELGGAWWYQWGTNGTDPNVTPASCPPDPDDEAFCDDGLAGTVGPLPGSTPASSPLPLAKAYLQKDALNTWQAEAITATAPVNVDLIDWGDNLESVDWYTRSQVRTEVVLFEDDALGDAEGVFPMRGYGMRHTSGWGISEVHGLTFLLGEVQAVEELASTQATVFSPCARLTIQLLLVDRTDAALADLIWVPQQGWAEPEGYEGDLVNPPIFNKVVYEAGDGPGYYNAEINVKGKIIYGYTWNVRKLHDTALNNKGAGDYRATFSFDATCPTLALNTFFAEGTTEIIRPAEEEESAVAAAAEEEPVGGGAWPEISFDNNLTYIDIRILERGGGGGGGGGGPPSGGGKPGGGGGPGGGGNH